MFDNGAIINSNCAKSEKKATAGTRENELLCSSPWQVGERMTHKPSHFISCLKIFFLGEGVVTLEGVLSKPLCCVSHYHTMQTEKVRRGAGGCAVSWHVLKKQERNEKFRRGHQSYPLLLFFSLTFIFLVCVCVLRLVSCELAKMKLVFNKLRAFNWLI